MKTFKQYREEFIELKVGNADSLSGSIAAQPPANLNIKTKNKIATSSTVKVNTLGDMTGGPYHGSAFS